MKAQTDLGLGYGVVNICHRITQKQCIGIIRLQTRLRTVPSLNLGLSMKMVGVEADLQLAKNFNSKAVKSCLPMLNKFRHSIHGWQRGD